MEATVFKTVDPDTGDVTLTGRGSEWIQSALAKGLLANDAADNAKVMLQELAQKDQEILDLSTELWARRNEVQYFRDERVKEYTKKSVISPIVPFLFGVSAGFAAAALYIIAQTYGILGI